jgi:uncharacterized damage-inducible protein DinB
MTPEAASIAAMLERLSRDMLAQLDGIPEPELNRALPLPETNSLYALATHTLGAGEYWALVMAGGRDIPRDRPAEFRATGTYADLVARRERWLADLRDVLDQLPATELDRVADVAEAQRRPWMGDDPFTVRDCLLHAVEHTALHLGHIQLTAQLLRAGQAGASEGEHP